MTPAQREDAVSSEMCAQIRGALAELARDEGVTILLAVESGSRAWGFHSTDSDYDVRFVYARPLDWHLRVRPGRDVIERPISDALDLSGWELRKALGLALGSNAVVSEWLRSPIVYADAAPFAAQMRDFCERALRSQSVTWHYRRLAERQIGALHGPDGAVKLKRYFYALRPALALRWLRLHADDPRGAAPPMNIEELLDETAPGADVRDFVARLIETKRAVGEMGAAPATHGPTDALIASELRAAAARLAVAGASERSEIAPAADALHADWTRWADAQSPSASAAL